MRGSGGGSLQCHLCGAPTQILETRAQEDNFILRRKRRCFNMHTYYTYEVTEQVVGTVAKAMRTSVIAARKRVELHKRNTTIVKDITLRGKTVKEVAAAHGIKPNTVSYVLKKFGVEDQRRKQEKVNEQSNDRPQ